MLSISSCATLIALISILFAQLSSAHTVITYPGWRGDNLHSNGTVNDTNGMAMGGNNPDGPYWPFGMQWSYPCGGMPLSTNRTKWPVRGGALAFQPGWFAGHGTAFIYINMGFGTNPPNMSNVMLSGVQLIGPTREPYPGTWCFPQLPLPANASVKVGDNATIQLIETAVHGAALYNCVDITFAEPEDVAEVNGDNCFNSNHIRSDLVFTTTSLQQEDEAMPLWTSGLAGWTVMMAIALGWLFM